MGAALTSWTAASCCVASVLSTGVESWCITSPASYKAALIVSNCFVSVAMVAAYLSLYYRLHEGFFIFAIGIFGLSTPGWGCSTELGSELCYPAREATVGSLLEVFSNLLGVAGTLITQRLIDAGLGAGVMLVMAGTAIVGGAPLLLLSGRLRRSEAEAEAEEKE